MASLLWPSWDEIWTENENIGPHRPAALLILWLRLYTSCFEDWTRCSLLSFHLWVQTCFGCVHYCTSVCPWMINKGLHFPPLSSLRSAILSRCVVSSGFRVTETSLSLFHFIRSTSLPFTQQQFISESCVFLRWKRSLRNHVDTASEYCRFIIGNESIIVVITLLKLWIRQLISSVVMMKLFGREGGDWVQGGSPGKIRSENLGGALVSNQERKRPLFTSVRRYKYYINPLRYD